MDEQNQAADTPLPEVPPREASLGGTLGKLAALLEAILFWSAQPMTIWELAAASGAAPEAVDAAIDELETSLAGRGVRLVRAGEEVALATAPGAASAIEKLRKEELSRELTKSALETLTAVAYAGPLARSEADYLRGVNCQYALRHLSLRGLVAREEKGTNRGRYRVTAELLAHMGVEKIEDLPNYAESRKSLREALEAAAAADREQAVTPAPAAAAEPS